MDADSSYGGSDTAQDSHSAHDNNSSLETTLPSPDDPRPDDVTTTAVHTVPAPAPAGQDQPDHYYHKNEVTLPVNYDDARAPTAKDPKTPHYLSTANLNINETLEHHSNLDEMNKNYKSTSYLNAADSPKGKRKTDSGIDNPAYQDEEPPQPPQQNGAAVKSTFGNGRPYSGDLSNATCALGLTPAAPPPAKGDEPLTEAVNLELINLKPGKGGKDVAGPYENGKNGMTTIPLKKDGGDAEMGNPYDEYFVPVNEHRKYMSKTRKGRNSVTFAETLATSGVDETGLSLTRPGRGVVEYPSWLTSLEPPRGEKLYVTMDKRGPKNKSKCFCWLVCLAVVAIAVILGILAAVGVIGGQQEPPPAQEVSSRQFSGSSPEVEAAGVYGGGGGKEKPRPTPFTPPPPLSTVSAILPTTDTSMIQVPRALESLIVIDNKEFSPALANKDSEEYKMLARSLEERIKNTLFSRDVLDYGDANIEVKVIDFTPGSVVVKYRVTWVHKDGTRTDDIINPESLKTNLNSHLEKNNSYIGEYHVAGVNAAHVLDLCKIGNNDCEHECRFDYSIADFVCTCPQGQMLSANEKTCVLEEVMMPTDYPFEHQHISGQEHHPVPSAEPEPTSEPEPTAHPEPAPVPEPSAEPSAEPSPEPSAEPSPEPEPTAEPTPEPEPASEPSPEPPVQHEPVTIAEPAPTAEPEPKSEPQPEPTSEPVPVPVTEPKPSPEPNNFETTTNKASMMTHDHYYNVYPNEERSFGKSTPYVREPAPEPTTEHEGIQETSSEYNHIPVIVPIIETTTSTETPKMVNNVGVIDVNVYSSTSEPSAEPTPEPSPESTSDNEDEKTKVLPILVPITKTSEEVSTEPNAEPTAEPNPEEDMKFGEEEDKNSTDSGDEYEEKINSVHILPADVYVTSAVTTTTEKTSKTENDIITHIDHDEDEKLSVIPIDAGTTDEPTTMNPSETPKEEHRQKYIYQSIGDENTVVNDSPTEKLPMMNESNVTEIPLNHVEKNNEASNEETSTESMISNEQGNEVHGVSVTEIVYMNNNKEENKNTENPYLGGSESRAFGGGSDIFAEEEVTTSSVTTNTSSSPMMVENDPTPGVAIIINEVTQKPEHAEAGMNQVETNHTDNVSIQTTFEQVSTQKSSEMESYSTEKPQQDVANHIPVTVNEDQRILSHSGEDEMNTITSSSTNRPEAVTIPLLVNGTPLIVQLTNTTNTTTSSEDVSLQPKIYEITTQPASSSEMTKIFTEIHKIIDDNKNETNQMMNGTMHETHQNLAFADSTETANTLDNMSPFLPEIENDTVINNIHSIDHFDDPTTMHNDSMENISGEIVPVTKPPSLENDQLNTTNPFDPNPTDTTNLAVIPLGENNENDITTNEVTTENGAHKKSEKQLMENVTIMVENTTLKDQNSVNEYTEMQGDEPERTTLTEENLENATKNLTKSENSTVLLNNGVLDTSKDDQNTTEDGMNTRITEERQTVKNLFMWRQNENPTEVTTDGAMIEASTNTLDRDTNIIKSNVSGGVTEATSSMSLSENKTEPGMTVSPVIEQGRSFSNENHNLLVTELKEGTTIEAPTSTENSSKEYNTLSKTSEGSAISEATTVGTNGMVLMNEQAVMPNISDAPEENKTQNVSSEMTSSTEKSDDNNIHNFSNFDSSTEDLIALETTTMGKKEKQSVGGGVSIQAVPKEETKVEAEVITTVTETVRVSFGNETEKNAVADSTDAPKVVMTTMPSLANETASMTNETSETTSVKVPADILKDSSTESNSIVNHYAVQETVADITTTERLFVKTKPTTAAPEIKELDNEDLSVIPLNPVEDSRQKLDKKRLAEDGSLNNLGVGDNDNDISDEERSVLDKFHNTPNDLLPSEAEKNSERAEKEPRLDDGSFVDKEVGDKYDKASKKSFFEKTKYFDKKVRLDKAIVTTTDEVMTTTTMMRSLDVSVNHSMSEVKSENEVKPVTEDFTLSGFSRCATGQFECANGTAVKDGSYCIPGNDRCDSVLDCNDGSDEVNCEEEKCPNNFQCASGQCLKRHLVCDGIVNCNDGSDEINCESWRCRFDEVSCDAGNGTGARCLPAPWRCDGRAQCPDGSDERGCQRAACPEDAFRCAEQEACVPAAWRCNGRKDCAGGEDERLCECTVEQFKCVTGGGCINLDQRCDGIMNCADSSDEWNCLRMRDQNVTLNETIKKESYLEVEFANNTWYPVCSSDWKDTYSTLACQSFGYAGALGANLVPYTGSNDTKGFFKLRESRTVNFPLLAQLEKTDSCDNVVSLTCQEFTCGSQADRGAEQRARIAGGERAAETQWPGLALLHDGRRNVQCTATVLSPLWAAASYACLLGAAAEGSLPPAAHWRLFAGSTRFFDGEGGRGGAQVREVGRLVPHPQVRYAQFEYINDIVLVKLATPLTMDRNVDAVCLPNEDIDERQLCVIAGWGISKPGDPNKQQYLHYLPVPVINTELCNSTQHYNGLINEDKICAGYTDSDKTPCYNDEGAPLMCFSNTADTWELQGILSHQENCGRTHHPAIYTSINKKILTWISNTTGLKRIINRTA